LFLRKIEEEKKNTKRATTKASMSMTSFTLPNDNIYI
jgi:hypothetical protein